MVHAPDTHEAAAFGNPQTVVHEPQWFTSALGFVSQPFAVNPSQFA